MTFASRHEAGRKLGRHLIEQGVQADIVLGLPRGGVLVAAEVAAALRLPLDVLVVRKIGHPRHREFAVGALAEGDTVVLDRAAIENTGVTQDELDEVIAEESERLTAYQQEFERAQPVNLAGQRVLLVDDGLATGATTEAAALSARNRGARRVTVAVPVASANAAERIERVADELIALLIDPEFDAVGRYYTEFPQATDEEVLNLLRTGRRP